MMNQIAVQNDSFVVKNTKNGKMAIVGEKDFIMGIVAQQSGVSELVSGLANVVGASNERLNVLEEKLNFVIDTLKNSLSNPAASNAKLSPLEEKVASLERLPIETLRKHNRSIMTKIARANGRRKTSFQDYLPLYDQLFQLTGFDVEAHEKEFLEGFKKYYSISWVNTLFNRGYGPMLTALAEIQYEEAN
jgi:hypothetical protein